MTCGGKKKSKAAMRPKNMKISGISVVVCTYNRAEMLSKALDCMVRQEGGGRFTFEIVVIDDGMASYVHKVKALASRLRIDRATQFVGEVCDVSPYYRQFAVLAVPSFAEAFGLVYGEAATYGIPAIGTSDGGAPEIIEDGVTGFIVPPEDPEKLAQAMLTILENPNLAKEMGKCAKERVLRLFSSYNLIKGVENVYKELLDRQI